MKKYTFFTDSETNKQETILSDIFVKNVPIEADVVRLFPLLIKALIYWSIVPVVNPLANIIEIGADIEPAIIAIIKPLIIDTFIFVKCQYFLNFLVILSVTI